MGNNLLMQSLVNAAIPMVEKLVNSGRIDQMLRSLKDSYREKHSLGPDESIEILVSSEADGCEYLNVVIINEEMTIKDNILYQRKLSDAIISLLKESQNANRNSK